MILCSLYIIFVSVAWDIHNLLNELVFELKKNRQFFDGQRKPERDEVNFYKFSLFSPLEETTKHIKCHRFIDVQIPIDAFECFWMVSFP